MHIVKYFWQSDFLMRRNNIQRPAALLGMALIAAGFMPAATSSPPLLHLAQAPAPPAPSSSPPADAAQPQIEIPQTAAEKKAAEDRLVFNRALVDAAVLLTDLENYRRGRSKKPVSLSAFRSLEIRLSAIAEADPSNTQARDMAKAMQMAQFQLLQPSVAVAAAADRELYASAMSEKMRDDGVTVSVSGPQERIVRFTSPHMTREMGQGLLQSAKIADQARRLEFSVVVFTNGRRSWRYDPGRNRYR